MIIRLLKNKKIQAEAHKFSQFYSTINIELKCKAIEIKFNQFKYIVTFEQK